MTTDSPSLRRNWIASSADWTGLRTTGHSGLILRVERSRQTGNASPVQQLVAKQNAPSRVTTALPASSASTQAISAKPGDGCDEDRSARDRNLLPHLNTRRPASVLAGTSVRDRSTVINAPGESWTDGDDETRCSPAKPVVFVSPAASKHRRETGTTKPSSSCATRRYLRPEDPTPPLASVHSISIAPAGPASHSRISMSVSPRAACFLSTSCNTEANVIVGSTADSKLGSSPTCGFPTKGGESRSVFDSASKPLGKTMMTRDGTTTSHNSEDPDGATKRSRRR